MGWTFYYKSKGIKAIDSLKEHCLGKEWWDEHVVTASATLEAVHVVARFTDDHYKNVYQRDPDGSYRAILVIKIKNVPKASDGYNFGYKDMTETMGPCGCECAPSIIEAASPLVDKIGPEPEYSSLRSAREYRDRSLALAKAKSTKRALKIGAKVKLAHALNFGGIALDEFIVDRCRLRGRRKPSTVFRSVKTGGLCRITAEHLMTATITEALNATT